MHHEGNPGHGQVPQPFAWGVLYTPPNPDGSPKMCQNCIMWSQDQRCSIFPADFNVPHDGICGYHVFGQPMETRPDHPGMMPVDPELAGFDIIAQGTYCGSCIYYEHKSGEKGVCHAVAKEKDAKPPQPVDFMGCCARWEGDA